MVLDLNKFFCDPLKSASPMDNVLVHLSLAEKSLFLSCRFTADLLHHLGLEKSRSLVIEIALGIERKTTYSQGC